MDPNRFTEKTREAILSAQKLAARQGQQQVDVEHLLAALLQQENGLAPAILSKAQVDVEGLRRRAEQEVSRLPRVSGAGGETFSPRLGRVLNQAEDEAKTFKDDFVSVEHVLLALI